MKLAVFDRMHTHNWYTGYDGASSIRAELVDAFGKNDITWFVPKVSLPEDDTTSPKPDLEKIAWCLQLAGISLNEFLAHASFSARSITNVNNSVQDADYIAYGNNVEDWDALLVFWRSSQFPEFEVQERLINRAVKRDIPVIVYDTDCWFAEDVNRIWNKRYYKRLAVLRPYVVTPRPELNGSMFTPYSFNERGLALSSQGGNSKRVRPYDLSYIGNDYDRREVLAKYFTSKVKRQLAGNWARMKEKPWNGRLMSSFFFAKDVLKMRPEEFLGSTPHMFTQAHHWFSKASLYAQPTRYDELQHVTLRFYESISAGCIPLIPQETSKSNHVFAGYVEAFPELLVKSAEDVVTAIDTVPHLYHDVLEWALELQSSRAKSGMRLQDRIKGVVKHDASVRSSDS